MTTAGVMNYYRYMHTEHFHHKSSWYLRTAVKLFLQNKIVSSKSISKELYVLCFAYPKAKYGGWIAGRIPYAKWIFVTNSLFILFVHLQVRLVNYSVYWI